MHLKPQNPAVILVIDDDPLTLTAVAAMLHLAGNECHCARDREAAVKAARSLKPDVIVCDIDLDRENGLDLCRELKQKHGLEDVAIVFLSSSESPEHRPAGSRSRRLVLPPQALRPGGAGGAGEQSHVDAPLGQHAHATDAARAAPAGSQRGARLRKRVTRIRSVTAWNVQSRMFVWTAGSAANGDDAQLPLCGLCASVSDSSSSS